MLWMSIFNFSNKSPDYKNSDIEEEFEKFIVDADHPCLMAQNVFRQNQLRMHCYGKLNDPANTNRILVDIDHYLANYDFSDRKFYTFLAVFEKQEELSEVEFEHQIWQQLQRLHDADDQPWDPTVGNDPNQKDFSMSLRGKAFYVVGLHPGSGRAARRAPYAAIAFNLHWQFEQLRELGTYYILRDKIRQRDVERHGSYNPMMEDFGANSSEAKQYSGRTVDKSWRCPFSHKKRSA